MGFLYFLLIMGGMWAVTFAAHAFENTVLRNRTDGKLTMIVFGIVMAVFLGWLIVSSDGGVDTEGCNAYWRGCY